jgi:hypothetical protein
MAKYEDLIIDQGADAAMELHLTNNNGSKKDLTGYSVAGMIRRTYNTSDSDAISFTSIVASPLTDGVVTVSLTNLETGDMTPARYVYDIELSYQDSDANTIIERILEGKIEVTPSVTR